MARLNQSLLCCYTEPYERFSLALHETGVKCQNTTRVISADDLDYVSTHWTAMSACTGAAQYIACTALYAYS